MPITSCVFKDDEKLLITSGLDYKYCILPQSPTSILAYVRNLFLNMAVLLLILLSFSLNFANELLLVAVGGFIFFEFTEA